MKISTIISEEFFDETTRQVTFTKDGIDTLEDFVYYCYELSSMAGFPYVIKISATSKNGQEVGSNL
jgi:hypothetical protein|tara:strand:+ start:1793 stop:1990 length:198 start_codon:yes stop_codon:yes gene_type:complete